MRYAFGGMRGLLDILRRRSSRSTPQTDVRLTSGAVLIVDDSSADQMWFARAFEEWNVFVAGTLKDAVDRLDEIDDLALAVLDIGLPDTMGPRAGPDDSVFWLARALRRRWPRASIIVMTGSADMRNANLAYAAGAEFVCKLDHDLNVRLIAERLERRQVAGSDANWAVLEELWKRYRLSRSELHVVAAYLRGLRAGAIATSVGISENTLKSHIRHILTKTGAADLRSLIDVVLGRRSATER